MEALQQTKFEGIDTTGKGAAVPDDCLGVFEHQVDAYLRAGHHTCGGEWRGEVFVHFVRQGHPDEVSRILTERHPYPVAD
ncbi:MAG: hypothetical protein KW804_00585 [Candidatus Doudnabacteria bacterium]|nr:hypothetical protein [Candidatus Doudnabacteria bacterium]